MSGGHFNGSNYVYWQVYQFADELENEIENNERPDEWGSCPNFNNEVLNILTGHVKEIRRIAEIMKAIDYLYSGDHAEDSFLQKLEAIEKAHKKEA